MESSKLPGSRLGHLTVPARLVAAVPTPKRSVV